MMTFFLKIQVEKLIKFQQTDSNDKPPTILIKSLYNSQSGWAGNKVIQVCIMIFKSYYNFAR